MIHMRMYRNGSFQKHPEQHLQFGFVLILVESFYEFNHPTYEAVLRHGGSCRPKVLSFLDLNPIYSISKK